MTVVGRVAALRRFPVKSMAGELLDAADLGWSGFEGDRQFAFVRADDTGHFPWFTGRQHPALLLHAARTTPEGRVRVTAPAGPALDDTEHDVTDPALRHALEAAGAQPLTLLRLSRGCYDAMPVSLLTTSLVAAVSAAHGATLDPLRFRANILIEPDARVDERDWQGREVAVGEVRLRATYATGRCAMIGLDPATAARDPAVLRTVARRFDGTTGLYATVARPGRIGTGDEVRLL